MRHSGIVNDDDEESWTFLSSHEVSQHSALTIASSSDLYSSCFFISSSDRLPIDETFITSDLVSPFIENGKSQGPCDCNSDNNTPVERGSFPDFKL